MNIHLSEEAVRYIEAHLARGHYRSASEFLEQVLRDLRRAEALYDGETERWLQAQETTAAKVWDNSDDARYDAL